MKIELIEGKLFVDGCEYVKKEAEQGEAKNGVKYTVDYCKANKIAVHCPLMSLYYAVDEILVNHGYPKTKHLESLYGNNRRETALYFDGIISIGNVEDISKRGYTIISSTQFIADNQPATVEQAEPKQPLFTTHDGVEVFGGDAYVYLNYKNEIKPKLNTSGWGKTVYQECIEAGGKYFSTHDAAVEYVKMNKPCISIQNILDSGAIVPHSPLCQKLVAALKLKVNP